MKTARTALFLGVLVSSLVLGRASLHAQPASAQVSVDGNDKPWNRDVPLATREAAKDLFLEGNRLFNIPVYARAADKYIAALAIWKHPAFYFNLAITQLNLGQDIEARDSLEKSLQHGEEPLGPEQFKEARRQLHDLEGHLGRIQISCQTQGAEVTLDGATLFTGPGSYKAWIKPTTHEVSATRSNYLPKSRRVTVRPGERKSLDMQLVALSDAEQTRWAAWKPWAVVASAAVVGLASGGLHAISRQGFKTYDDGFQRLPCLMTGCSESDIGAHLNGQLRRATLEQKIAVGGYITAGALITTGAILLYLNRPHLAEQDTADPPRPRLSILPAMSGGMLGVQMTVSR